MDEDNHTLIAFMICMESIAFEGLTEGCLTSFIGIGEHHAALVGPDFGEDIATIG